MLHRNGLHFYRGKGLKRGQSLYDLTAYVLRVFYSLEEKYYVYPRQEPLSNRIVFVHLFVAVLGTFSPSFYELMEVWALEDEDSLSGYPHIQLSLSVS